MIIKKIIEVGINIEDIRIFASENGLINLLKKIYEKKNYKECHIIEIIKILRKGEIIVNKFGDPNIMTTSVIFLARVFTLRKNEIIPNCRIIKTAFDESVAYIFEHVEADEYKIKIIISNNNESKELPLTTVNHIVSIIVDCSIFANNKPEISAIGHLYPERQPNNLNTIYFIDYKMLNTEGLFEYIIGMIQKLDEEKPQDYDKKSKLFSVYSENKTIETINIFDIVSSKFVGYVKKGKIRGDSPLLEKVQKTDTVSPIGTEEAMSDLLFNLYTAKNNINAFIIEDNPYVEILKMNYNGQKK